MGAGSLWDSLYVEGNAFITCFVWDRETQVLEQCKGVSLPGKEVYLFIFHAGQSCSHPSYHICLAWNLYLESLGEIFLASFISLFAQTQKDKKNVDLIFPHPSPAHKLNQRQSSVDGDAAKIFSG